MKCQAPDCDHEVTHSIAWKTGHMTAPAFWYFCDDHALELKNQIAERGDNGTTYIIRTIGMGETLYHR